MSDEKHESNGAANGAANGTAEPVVTRMSAFEAPPAKPKRRTLAQQAADATPKRAPRARRAPPIAKRTLVDELDGAELVEEHDDDQEGNGAAFVADDAGEAREAGSDRRVQRVRFSATLHPHVWAETIVYAMAHDLSISTLIEHAVARFLLVRGITVPGVWDDQELRALLAVGPAAGAPPR